MGYIYSLGESVRFGCPQNCIDSAIVPFHIEQTHCLHCGNCMTACPVEAVRKAMFCGTLKMLSRLIVETKKGQMFGEWNDYGRLVDY